MSNKVLWFVAGTAAGIYASVKAKRAAYRLSMPGLIDQASALGVGVRAFKSEMQDGMYEKETEIRQALVSDTQNWELPANSETEQLWEKDSN
ncbi:MAG: hypothetical protein GX678_08090 [Actinomycetales bacterium]|nr:hypothetical protein [Actinomycetales bacterium]